MPYSKKLAAIEFNPSQPAVASVIWLHGLGAEASNFAPIVPQLQLPESLPVRFVFPNAPRQPVTVNGGMVMPAWYDVLGLDEKSRQDADGLHKASQAMHALVEAEIERGIPSERIVIGGFSQGGALALYSGFRYEKPLAGIMALSAYLPVADRLAAEINPANRHTPVFMAHGTHDEILPFAWAEMADDLLKQMHIPVEFRQYPMTHTLCEEEIRDLSQWFQHVFK